MQYAWLRVLAGDRVPVAAVGDDDQSIYGWRGARIENIQQFSKDFPGTQFIRLEQNYRSTATILAAANAVIAHNHGRLGKELWTSGEEGEPISLYAAFNEMDEARFIVERLQDWSRERQRAQQCGDSVSLERAIARTRRGADSQRCAVSHLRRPTFLRSPRNQKCRRVFASAG